MRMPAILISLGVVIAILSVTSIQRYAPCAVGQPCPTTTVDPFWLTVGVLLVTAGAFRAVLDRRRSRDIRRR